MTRTNTSYPNTPTALRQSRQPSFEKQKPALRTNEKYTVNPVWALQGMQGLLRQRYRTDNIPGAAAKPTSPGLLHGSGQCFGLGPHLDPPSTLY